MTIKIEYNIDELTAFSIVRRILEEGKLINMGNSYCYLTSFDDIDVEVIQYRKSLCFKVYRKI